MSAVTAGVGQYTSNVLCTYVMCCGGECGHCESMEYVTSEVTYNYTYGNIMNSVVFNPSMTDCIASYRVYFRCPWNICSLSVEHL